MVFQVCGVNGPLGSARRICREKNRIVLDEEGSYIEDKATGLRTKIEDSEDGEGYVLSLVVPRKEDGVKREMGF